MAATNVPCRLSIFYGRSPDGWPKNEEVEVAAPCIVSRYAHRILIVTSPITPAGRSPSSATATAI